MVMQRIAFRTDANSEIGTGHFMRCLSLAAELKKTIPEIVFITRGLPAFLAQELRKNSIEILELPVSFEEVVDSLVSPNWLKISQAQDVQDTMAALAQRVYDWLIVDHYALDNNWETPIRSRAKKIMVIDDLADRKHDCDLLLDQNYYHDMHQRYVGKVSNSCQLLLGPSYALLREEFRDMRTQVKPRLGFVKNLLVFFGGVDSYNYTGTVLSAIVASNQQVSVDVVIGQQHPNLHELINFCKESCFSYHIQTNKMAVLMAKADLSIGAGGTAIWERFCMGLPSICISTVENQEQQVADLMNENLVIAKQRKQNVFEFIERVLIEVKRKPNYLANMSKSVYDLVDGNGVKKIAISLIVHGLKIRMAKLSDSKNIFNWRNHPKIRSNSRSTELIEWTDHEKWFVNTCGHKNSPILIGEIEGQALGVVRFDIQESCAEVSIFRVPYAGHKGVGRKLLIEAESWLKLNHPDVKVLHAQVLKKNELSINLFEKSQYVKIARAAHIEFVKQL